MCPEVGSAVGWQHIWWAMIWGEMERATCARVSLFVNSRKTASVAEEQYSWTTTLIVHHAKLFFEMVRVTYMYMHAPGTCILFYDGVAGIF